MVLALLLDVIAPILLMVGCGALLRRRFAISVDTLSKANLYLFTPAFIFHRVTHSRLGGGEMLGIVAATCAMIAAMGGITVAVGRLRRVPRDRLATLAMATMFYNSGNYGLPLSELAYPGGPNHTREGAASQTFVALTQNVFAYTVGLAIAASAGVAATGGRSRLAYAAGRIARMPVLYTLTCALVGHHFFGPDAGHTLPKIIDSTAAYLAGALIPTALITLGAQLASSPGWPRWRDVGFAMVMRLLMGPLIMLGMLWLLHRQLPGTWLDLWPWPAEALVLTAGVPSAVNTLLLVLELDGDPRLTADTIFWTTVGSGLTILGWLVVLQYVFPG